LAGNLEKPFMFLYGTEWRKRGYGLRRHKLPHRKKKVNKFHELKILIGRLEASPVA
jgi:hypothetical protein